MRNEYKELAGILGGEPVLHRELNNSRDLEEITREGLPKKALQSLASYLKGDRPRSEVIYEFIPESTYKSRTRLSSEASEKVVRIACLLELSNFVLGKEQAISFLTKNHTLLDNRKPYEVALSEVGARRVEEILWKIFYGLPV
jgi:putative toxin-antitoxin system antitoxin component (TIGR02293 family)